MSKRKQLNIFQAFENRERIIPSSEDFAESSTSTKSAKINIIVNVMTETLNFK